MVITVYYSTEDAFDGHGGVGLYINVTFTYFQREDLSIFIPHVFESIFFDVQAIQNKLIILGVIYCPNTLPGADIELSNNII